MIHFLRAIIVLILLFINMVIVSTLIIIFSGIVLLLPIKNWRHQGRAWIQNWPVWWMDINALILKIFDGAKWEIAGPNNLDTNHWYLLICNHQSWIDILILGIYFRHKIPNLKFFMKKELLWTLPGAGLACYLLGYPFMARHSHEQIRKKPELKNIDIQTTRASCNKFKEFPTTVVIFVEGTRFTTAKKESQQSPYQHLLKPKATGVALVLSELQNHLSSIINVSLQYHPQYFSLFDFLLGKVKKIHLHIELLPVTADLIGDPYQDRLFRKNVQGWLNQLWSIKDQKLTSFNE
ncbi:MAG: 1-acyl-sn-glycerol-3-phosphate acyltransferase [Proteobacteria bacterium]|nr:1-acyl-sn-glycerol-3-phosphate acyltransferase [Pseudomonadota bacterium]